jgi:hypothetical protein
MAVARYRDYFNRAILIAALERAVDAGVIDDYIVKGGAAIELRFGVLARATRDLDVELPVPLASLRDEYGYARHVVDVLFLARSDVNLDSVRAACHLVFELRAPREGRVWPPRTITVPARWIGEYAATLAQYPDLALQPEDVPAEFTRLLTTLIGGS